MVGCKERPSKLKQAQDKTMNL